MAEASTTCDAGGSAISTSSPWSQSSNAIEQRSTPSFRVGSPRSPARAFGRGPRSRAHVHGNGRDRLRPSARRGEDLLTPLRRRRLRVSRDRCGAVVRRLDPEALRFRASRSPPTPPSDVEQRARIAVRTDRGRSPHVRLPIGRSRTSPGSDQRPREAHVAHRPAWTASICQPFGSSKSGVLE